MSVYDDIYATFALGLCFVCFCVCGADAFALRVFCKLDIMLGNVEGAFSKLDIVFFFFLHNVQFNPGCITSSTVY